MAYVQNICCQILGELPQKNLLYNGPLKGNNFAFIDTLPNAAHCIKLMYSIGYTLGTEILSTWLQNSVLRFVNKKDFPFLKPFRVSLPLEFRV